MRERPAIDCAGERSPSSTAAGGRPPARWLFLSALLALAASLAGAEDLRGLLDRSSLSRPDRQAVEALFEESRLAGVPQELLLPRLQEGLAKRVAAARLQAALRAELAFLRRARRLLEGAEGGARLLADGAAWARTANLLAAGVGEDELLGLLAAAGAGAETYRAASALYVSLRKWGLPQRDGLRLVAALSASALHPESYPVVHELLVEARRLRVPPEDAAEELVRLLPLTRSSEDLRESAVAAWSGGAARQ